jgi:hypothetical protein
MFLNFIKEFFVKKTLNKNLHSIKNEVFTSKVETVGLLVDESNFRHSKALQKELILNGILSENIKTVVYRDKLKKKKEYSLPTFGKKQMNWRGEFESFFLNEFIKTEFDLLISYYDVEKTTLLMVTQKSRAKFKVGFALIDSRFNRWMIAVALENYKLFISELFRYLRNIK